MGASDAAGVRPALWVARSFRGLSKKDLAEQAIVSRQVVSALEDGESYPIALEAVAQILGFPASFLAGTCIVPGRDVLHFRSKATITESAIARVQAQCGLFALIANAFMGFAKFSKPKLPVIHGATMGDVIEVAAESIRRAVKIRPDVPIKDAVRVVEAIGVFVGTFAFDDARIDGVAYSSDAAVVLLNEHSTWVRRRFSAAHELGHLVLHSEGPSSAEREMEANRFAGALLVPRPPFWREFPRPAGRQFDWTAVIAMKQRWGISIQALITRAFQLGIISPIQYRTAYMHISQSGWRTREPGDLNEPERPATCAEFVSGLEKRGKLKELCHRVDLYLMNVSESLGVRIEPRTDDSRVVALRPRLAPPS